MVVLARCHGCALDFASVELRPATREGCAALVNTLLHNSERMEGECLHAKPEAHMHMTTPRCKAVPTPAGFPLGWAREPAIYAVGGCLYAHSPRGHPTVR